MEKEGKPQESRDTIGISRTRHPAPELSASKPEDQYADRWSAVVRLGRNVNHQQSAEAARSWLLFGCPLTSW